MIYLNFIENKFLPEIRKKPARTRIENFGLGHNYVFFGETSEFGLEFKKNIRARVEFDRPDANTGSDDGNGGGRSDNNGGIENH